MTIHLDTTRPARLPSELVAVVEAVLNADPRDEADWLEWKTGVDITAKHWQFQIARHILGFANRDPTRAVRVAGGCAYLVLGAAPKELVGVQPVDPAHLESWVAGYVGPTGPQWNPHYVTVRGTTVLVILTEAPQPGDKILTLRKEYEQYRSGTVFIRRVGCR
jgi:hypothetical protein